MQTNETGKIFPIDPNSSLLYGVSVDEIFKDKKKQWREARKQGDKPRKSKSDASYQKRGKSQP